MTRCLPGWGFSGETEICIAIQHSLFRKEESKERRKMGKWEGKSPRGTETERGRRGRCRLPRAVGLGLPALAACHLWPSPGRPGLGEGHQLRGSAWEAHRSKEVTRLYGPFTSSFKSIVKSQPNYSKLSIFTGQASPGASLLTTRLSGDRDSCTARWSRWLNLVLGSGGTNLGCPQPIAHRDPPCLTFHSVILSFVLFLFYYFGWEACRGCRSLKGNHLYPTH